MGDSGRDTQCGAGSAGPPNAKRATLPLEPTRATDRVYRSSEQMLLMTAIGLALGALPPMSWRSCGTAASFSGVRARCRCSHSPGSSSSGAPARACTPPRTASRSSIPSRQSGFGGRRSSSSRSDLTVSGSDRRSRALRWSLDPIVRRDRSTPREPAGQPSRAGARRRSLGTLRGEPAAGPRSCIWILDLTEVGLCGPPRD